ncbi:MAG: response regulator transcription factor [Acidimicrobiia bacterium]
MSTAASTGTAPRILVVDDEDNLSFVVSAALKLSGFETTTAASGLAALKAVAASRPDLIVLDVMLPDVDGFEVCRRLRSDGSDVPIIFLTARDDAADRLRGLTIGGDDYLTKPFSVEELVARVKVILRRVGIAAGAEVMRFDDLELDDDSHRVTRGGTEITLSPTEYKLLRFLLRNRGRVLSRNQILDHVWDYDFNGESTVVETFVSSLRRKIDSGGPALIHTVRGVGYRLGTP